LVHRFRKERTKVGTLEGIVVASAGDGVVVVSFTDEHDLATSTRVGELLDGLVRKNDLVVADLSDALFVDSSTLRVLIRAHKLAVDRDSRFRLLLGDGCAVKRSFEISGILNEITWVSTREEALNGSGPSASGADDEAAA
jgi:anti-anti-sigma factor